MEKLHAAVARGILVSELVKKLTGSDHFLKFGRGKIARSCSEKHVCKSKHAAVARSTFASQNVKNLRGTDHFLKLGCGKIARRCSEKHICKSKCEKTEGYGPLFEVGMWKNYTPL